MNKYLLLSAAAVLASAAGGASASTIGSSFQFGSSGGGSYCDGGTVYKSGPNNSLWSWQHTNNNCEGGVSIGMGVCCEKKVGGFNGATLSDNFFAANYNSYAITSSFKLPKKLKEGQPWLLFICFSGTSAFVANSGKLKNVSHPQHKGTRSTAGALRQLIELRRSAQKT